MLVLANQGVEDQFANQLGLRVAGHAWIKIGWTVLNDHHDGVGVGTLAAGQAEQQNRNHKQKPKPTTEARRHGEGGESTGDAVCRLTHKKSCLAQRGGSRLWLRGCWRA